MSTGLKLRSCVLEAKHRLAEGREKLRRQHDAGSPGIQVCARLTDMLDTVILDLYEAALADLTPEDAAILRQEVALVAHGGYGRRDVAPFSDVDLMILHSPDVAGRVILLAKRLMLDVFDAGLVLGHSVRTVQQACKLSLQDVTIYTALVESRLLAGSETLFSKFTAKFQGQIHWRWRRLLREVEESRAAERSQFGETVYLLEPNVKRSRGGLRDIQLLRWAGFTRYGVADPEGLSMAGHLEKDDQRSLRRASEYLLRLRNEMHFYAGKSSDVLDRGEQVRLAEAWGFRGDEGLVPPEQFMREYFQHTDVVSHVVQRFLAHARPGVKFFEFFSLLTSHQVEGDFRVGPTRISATSRGLQKLDGNLTEILRLTDLANLYDKRIAPATWEAVHRSARKLPDELPPQAIERFLSLLSQPGRLGEMLRNLHDAGILEKIIPAFAHARSLMQFNDYHKYTVDEHCIRAVEQATYLLSDKSTIGQVYRALPQKRTLHLALLIHDLGKGFAEDHSEVGLGIAAETARRLQLPERETEVLKFLVHKHLMMSHLAFRRDTSDDQLVVRFAVDVGSPEALRMLYLLTACDLAAVGPGVWNDWKAEVLTDLYYRAMEHLAGESLSVTSEERAQKRRDAIGSCLANGDDREWFHQQIETLPKHYLYGTPPERIAAELRQLRRLDRGDASAWGRYLPERGAVEFTVGTYDDITPGVFHKLTGALSSKGLQILSAEINTLAEGLVFDRFLVVDPDFAAEPPRERLESVNRALVDSLRARTSQPPTFRKVWRPGHARSRDVLAPLPTQVRIDNSTSDRFTIIDVFAHDRMGLLYTITRTLFEMGISVALAKIGTYLDQVVDVFYVTDQEGNKVFDEERWRQIRERLLEAIGALETAN
jgi:[protein-PII] uridylyltransferase